MEVFICLFYVFWAELKQKHNMCLFLYKTKFFSEVDWIQKLFSLQT